MQCIHVITFCTGWICSHPLVHFHKFWYCFESARAEGLIGLREVVVAGGGVSPDLAQKVQNNTRAVSEG